MERTTKPVCLLESAARTGVIGPNMGAPPNPESNGTRSAALASSSTITHDQFLLWKQRKDAEAAARAAEASRQRVEGIAAGRVRMNGRELFEQEPWVFDDSRFE